MRSVIGRIACGVFALILLAGNGQDSSPALVPTGRALIVVGLPGDAEHEALFRASATRWRDWLTGPLGFPRSEVRILSGSAAKDGFGDAPATAESIAAEVRRWQDQGRPGDRSWVFVLGHANFADGHAFLHLPGPDLRDDAFAALFRDLPAREQVFWMTTPASGWFLPGLSKAGRVVIAATERDKEFNETEFPHALADVARHPLATIDADHDGRASVLEVYRATVAAVEKRFAADRRAPTEHAQLDDDGDGVGTGAIAANPPTPGDGSLAARIFLP